MLQTCHTPYSTPKQRSRATKDELESYHSFSLESPLFGKTYSLASTSPSSEKIQLSNDSDSTLELELDSELV